MAENKYKATLSPGGEGRSGWCMIFRHPILLGSDGKTGKRIRRGLGTSDRAEAQRLVDQANVILSDESLWTQSAREFAEKSFDERIVKAFYDDLVPIPRDGWGLRDGVIPLPKDGFTRVQFLGTTGTGKTTILRQFIGTGKRKDRFPSTSTARTTTCDIEIVVADATEFKAAVSFLPKDEVRQYVEECVCAAVLSQIEQQPDEVIVRRFLEHTDQRFRLSYVIGILPTQRGDDEDDLPEELEPAHAMAHDSASTDTISDQERQILEDRLRGYVAQLKNLALASSQQLARDLNLTLQTSSPEERDTFEELLEDHLRERDDFHALVDAILDDIETRFSGLEDGEVERDRGDWPSIWKARRPASERTEFMRSVNRFSSNHASQFGRLLTPLVEGIRVAGPFKPEWFEEDIPNLVLMDGEGLGHAASAGASLSTNVTKRYHIADAIIMVDSATQPMLGASSAALKSVASSGQLSKLVIAFTHLDQVEGDNLRNEAAKRDHIFASSDNVFSSLGKELGRGVENSLKKLLLERTFFLSNIQEIVPTPPQTRSQRSTLQALRDLLTLLRRMGEPAIPPSIAPIYDDANLVLCVSRAVNEFREPWRARLGLVHSQGIRAEHWARIKALTRRLGVFGRDEYDDLKPVADFRARLLEQVRPFLEEPLRWKPSDGDEEMRVQAVDAISREVSKSLEDFTKSRVLVSRATEWLKAYSHRGQGSTWVRSREVETIYDRAAPIPGGTADPSANAFLLEIRKLLRKAIRAGGGEIIGLDGEIPTENEADSLAAQQSN
jgi:hypothetical protein